MGHLSEGDEELHYEDGSHRWLGADPADEVWQARMLAHMKGHQAEYGPADRPVVPRPRPRST